MLYVNRAMIYNVICGYRDGMCESFNDMVITQGSSTLEGVATGGMYDKLDQTLSLMIIIAIQGCHRHHNNSFSSSVTRS